MKLFIISSCLFVILMAAITKGSVLGTQYEEEDTLDFGNFLEKQLTRDPNRCCCGTATCTDNQGNTITGQCTQANDQCHNPCTIPTFSSGGKCVDNSKCCHPECHKDDKCNTETKCNSGSCAGGCCTQCILDPNNCIQSDCPHCDLPSTCKCQIVNEVQTCVCVPPTPCTPGTPCNPADAPCPDCDFGCTCVAGSPNFCQCDPCTTNTQCDGQCGICPPGQSCLCQGGTCQCACDPTASPPCPATPDASTNTCLDEQCLLGTATCTCDATLGCICGPCDPDECNTDCPLYGGTCTGTPLACVCNPAPPCTPGNDCTTCGACPTGTKCKCQADLSCKCECDTSFTCPAPGANNQCGTTSCPGSKTCECADGTGCNVCGPCDCEECNKDCGENGGQCDSTTGKCVCRSPCSGNGCTTNLIFNIKTCGGTTTEGTCSGA